MCKVKVLAIPLKFPAWELVSLYKCSDGEIGRHEGLKIPWAVMPIRVRVPIGAQYQIIYNFRINNTVCEYSAIIKFLKQSTFV